MSERIHRVVAALSHLVTAEEVAAALVREAAEALGARATSVFLFDDDRNRIRLVRALGYPAAALERWGQWAVDRSPLLAPVRAGEAVFTSSRLQDARFDAELSRDFGDGAGCVVPLQAGGRVLGFLGASYGYVREFEPADRELVLTLAAHCAQTFERARLFEAERAARAAADSARRQLEAVLHQLPIGVSVVGADGSVVINAMAQAIWGVSLQRTVRERHHVATMQHLDGREYREAELPIVRALQGEVVSGEELQITRSDGTKRVVRASAAPVRDEGGCIGSAVAAFADVTHEKQAEEELRAAESRYRAVLRATNDVIWDFDAATGRLEWNGALERVFGHRAEDSNRHPGGGYAWWLEQIHPDDRAAVDEAYRRADTLGLASWSGEYRFRRADGTYVPSFDCCVFERDDSGRVLRVVGAISDISAERRLLDGLREAVQARDDFLSCAGHELRTPLAALAAQLLGLEQLPLDEAGRARKLDAAERLVRRLTKLVDELLDVSRIVHGKLRLEREHVDLSAMARDAAARLADDFQRGGTPLTIDAPAPVDGSWDRLRIDLVITNLLVNALRYGERRPVCVRVEAAGDRARVAVEDQGIGIDPADQERIFERFMRAVPSRRFGGLGIGLWLSRQIVDAHGGELRVESRAGAGSRFIVELPRA